MHSQKPAKALRDGSLQHQRHSPGPSPSSPLGPTRHLGRGWPSRPGDPLPQFRSRPTSSPRRAGYSISHSARLQVKRRDAWWLPPRGWGSPPTEWRLPRRHGGLRTPQLARWEEQGLRSAHAQGRGSGVYVCSGGDRQLP